MYFISIKLYSWGNQQGCRKSDRQISDREFQCISKEPKRLIEEQVDGAQESPINGRPKRRPKKKSQRAEEVVAPKDFRICPRQEKDSGQNDEIPTEEELTGS